MENLILHTENITSKPTKSSKKVVKNKIGIPKNKTYKDLISAANKFNMKPPINLEKLNSKVAKIGMLNCDEVNDVFNYFLFCDTSDPTYAENLKELEPAFLRTNKVSAQSYIEFYRKYKKYDETIRKGVVHESCSNKFIEEVKNNCIIPNPVGIIKRSGDEKILNLK